MPYSIKTKDGITIRNIPDDVAPDSPELKERVLKARGGGEVTAATAPQPNMEKARGGAAHVKDRPAGDIPGADSFMAEVPRAMVQGPLAKVLSGYAGMAGAALPGPAGQGARFQQATEEALSFSPKSPTSQAILTGMGLPYEYLVEKPAHAIGSKIAEKGAPATGAIVEGAIDAAPAALGFRGFKFKPPETVTLARKYGMALTPTEGGGGVVSKVTEGLSGEEKLSKAIARKNASKGADALARDIGIPEGTELTRESIAAARRAAHAAYQEARGMGEIATGPQYAKALDAIEAQYRNAAKSFPNAKPGVAQQVMELVDGLRVEKFDASAAVDQINGLREAANDAYRAGNGGLGKAYKGAAKALEDAFVEHVQELGKGQPALLAPHRGIVERLQAARERIAKTYEADKALEKDGAINPQKLAKMEKDGKPLTGAAKDIAALAEDAPRSFRRDTGGNVLFPTWADVIMSGIAAGGEGVAHGVASGGATLPLMFARPAARAVMASDPYQAFQGSPVPSALGYASPFATSLASIAKEQAEEERRKGARK